MKKRINPSDLIVFENDDYWVINKPPFVSTLEDRVDKDHILSLFKEMAETVFVCHRLDKETSGALLLAKNEEAYRNAALQFEHREVEKVYHAIVEGRFTDEVIKVEVPLKVAGSGQVRIDNRQGKPAETLFRLGETFGKYTLVEAKPISGRRHQIRVHLQYLNFPICGDTQYGGRPIFLSDFKKNYRPARDHEERPLFDRVALHAFSLKINGVDGQKIHVECPYPKDLEMILGKFKKFS